MRLGVNIDHVATLRNARGEPYPDPLRAALLAESAGADNITCHLREDRRHIKDDDVRRLRAKINIPMNFEIAVTDEMLDIALEINPQEVTLVPEGRQELTTESGLNVFDDRLKRAVSLLQEQGIVVVLFVEPTRQAVQDAVKSGAQAVEFHTGELCQQLVVKEDDKATVLAPLHEAAQFAKTQGVAVHLGHGINYQTASYFRDVPHAVEANIGHSIIAEAVFIGLHEAVRKMKNLLS